ncbi:transcription termination factor MTERF4, chloroplastic isoform X2 [Phalaenopsis equestris]|uniref:transcription termination factor MTERF4, chloroplastic isoform X2 n=1 Tax=Phalaenopsis equestris TaxID=78828 RepID=UPI0009E61B19|nr:transcription termination factor MTERF4, chloroplastic isoform X2 [Phalaenopsis equestris]
MQGGAIPVASLGFFESRVAGCSFSTNPALFYHHLHPILPPSRIFPVLVRPRSTRFQSARVQFSVGEYGHSWPGEPAMEEAREAIMEILREYGASEDDTARIASNSPQYLDMIVGNVLELDEHSLWSSWGPDAEEGGEDIASRTFREKVRCMAKSKRDGGLLPFLESIGVRNSSAMLIARYLVSEKLPDLIDKVKFVKEMLSSSSENISVVGKNARRMMMHLSIFADDDIQETLAFFEKMESRNGGLSMLDQGDTYFAHLIESFPKLLLLSIENHLKPLADFLLLVGVPMASIRSVLLLYPPIIFYDIENDIKSRLDVLKKVRKASVDVAIRSWPHILGCSTHRMNSIVVQFGQLGVYARRLVPVITSSPQLLLRRPDEFLQVVSFLKLFGFDDITIGRILCRCPEIFAANVDDTLQRKVNILTDFGISRKFLPRVIRKYPELLLLDVNTSLLPRMRYLMDIGLSKEEVSSMVSRFSPLLGYSIEAVFKPKLEFLQTIMQKPLKEIVEYPRYFSYSLDKKIKPRFWVLKSRNIACSLKDMLGKNNEEFAEEYMGIGRLLVPPAPVPPEVDQ